MTSENSNELTTSATFPREIRMWGVWSGVLPLIGLLPMLILQGQHLWSRPQFRYFPLAIALVLAWAWFESRRFRSADLEHESCSEQNRRLACIALLIAAVTYLFSVLRLSPWLAHLAAIQVFFAWKLPSATSWRRVVIWTGVLLTTLPLPGNINDRIDRWISHTAAWAAGQSLDALNVMNYAEPEFIQIRGSQIAVAEVVNGVGSIHALIAIAILIATFRHRSLLASLISISFIPILTIADKLIQLLAIALFQEYYNRDMSTGYDNALLVATSFLLIVGNYWLIEQFVAHMLHPVPAAEPQFIEVFRHLNRVLVWPQLDPYEDLPTSENSSAAIATTSVHHVAKNWLSHGRQSTLVRVLAGLFLCVGIVPAIVLMRSGSSSLIGTAARMDLKGVERVPKEDSLPEVVGSVRRISFRHERRTQADPFGQQSLIWKYLWQGQVVTISLDFPFRRGHSLSESYSANGWRIISENDIENDSEWPGLGIQMLNELGGRGYAISSVFSEDLNPFSPSEEHVSAEVTSHEGRGIFSALWDRPSLAETNYQIQIFCETGTELSENQLVEFQNIFKTFRKILFEVAGPMVHELTSR